MRKIVTPGLLLGLLIVTVANLPALASPTDPGRLTSPDQAALAQGIALYESGEREEALSLLRSLVVRFPDSAVLPQAYLYLARIFREQERPEEALLYLRRIPPGQRGSEVNLLHGVILIDLGDAPRGLAILRGLDGAPLQEEDQALRFSALTRGNAALGRNLEALFFLDRHLAVVPATEREGLVRKARQLMRERLSDADLAEAAFLFGGSAVGQEALLQQALRAYSRGEAGQAKALAEQVVRSQASYPFRREALALLEGLTGRAWVQRSIGIILPLSGRYATFGELVRRGMDLALEAHNSEQPPVKFIYRDTGADPEQSALVVSTLANQELVMAIAGPLTGAAAEAAARQAQVERVPLLSMSQREGLPEIGPYVFRNSLTSMLQVRALVRYAMEEQGFFTFGLLFPENRLGREMAELFRREVEGAGGIIAAAQSYAENATDFRRQVRLLQGRNPDAPEERTRGAVSTEEPPAPPPFQALFIPDYADRVGLIAPQLPYYGLDKMPLLGINGWNSPELLRLAGRFVEGAVFVDGFFRHSPYPFVQDFVELYYAKYREDPTILEAQGFDIAGILLSVLDRPEVSTREDLRLALAALENYPGVTGATSFGRDGEAEKILFLLQVRNGNIVQIN